MFSIRTATVAGALVFLAAGAAYAAKSQPPQNISVPGGDLTITLKMDELQICADGEYIAEGKRGCFFAIGSSTKRDDATLFGTVDAEGNFEVSGKNENYTKKAKDDDENVLPCVEHTAETKAAAEDKAEDKDDEKKDASEKDEGEEAEEDDEWKSKPVLTVEARRTKAFDAKIRKDFCQVEASGVASGDGNDRTFTLSADILPEGDYYVYSSGWFGAYVEGTVDGAPQSLQIGSPTMYGPLKLARDGSVAATSSTPAPKKETKSDSHDGHDH